MIHPDEWHNHKYPLEQDNCYYLHPVSFQPYILLPNYDKWGSKDSLLSLLLTK